MNIHPEKTQRMPRRRILQKDIANAAGVSISTVSRVLNNVDVISDDLRERVLKAATALGYQSKTDQLRQINLFISLITSSNLSSDQFHSAIMVGVEEECRRHDIRLSHIVVKPDDINRAQILERVWSNPDDGHIFMSVDDNDLLKSILEYNFRVISINAEHKNLGIDTILPDNEYGAHLAVQYLIDHGHRQILHTTRLVRSTIKRRHEAYKATLHDAGIPYNPALILDTSMVMQDAYQRMKRFLYAPHPEFTAIFCANDSSAIGIARALQEANVRIPQDVSIVGFDDIPMAEFTVPALTTIRVEREEMGRLAVRRLLERSTNPHLLPIKVEIITRLIERQSVAYLHNS
ncbi:LacI family DNA-binding transcriptional regulator [Dictyobacter aurantiacus]|uniref:LacI family transcriptional regulator n=1 Tax=Dictyobacter aurantiacus TaxID=1936993 RepID=A0A401ZSX6_9CHLR|nr:LacI family DNA-binding transcriptional regulator [Dictyobacter aurantiacus]GCE10018.1 LacI family transcriptional regulator [Dictyobacter aurantiacus]